MTRLYENPYSVAERLEEAKNRLAKAQMLGCDPETIISLHDDVEDLEARLRFAWDDAEAVELGID